MTTTAPPILAPTTDADGAHAPAPHGPRRSHETQCTHCGLPVPRGLILGNAAEQFCCTGCQTAYAIIHSCGLDRYYALREAALDQRDRPRATDRSYAEFDQDAFRELYVRGHRGEQCSTDLLLQGVHCGACVWLVERLPRLLPGVAEARLNFRRSTLTVTWNDGVVSLAQIARLLDSIGYPPAPARDARARRAAQNEDRRQLIRIGVAGACAGNVMLLAICLYAGLFDGIDHAHEQFFRWLSLGITAVSLAWPGRVFFRSSLAAIRTRTPHLDVPITLALLVGAVWSVYTTIRGSGEIYFDSLSVLVFVLLCGRFVQHRQQRSAADALELLFSLTPTSARRVDAGVVTEVPIESLAPGDLVEVRAGDALPADGVVEYGESRVDQALLTGESRPVHAGVGSTVCAGAVNVSSTLRVRVHAAGERSRIGRLMALVEQAAQRKAPIVQLADTLSAWFIVGMISLAVIAGAAWMFIDPARAVDQAVALLVVTCPCALGLATPLSLTVALGRAARAGMLVKGADSVQRLAGARTIILDKTGTLTTGRMSAAFVDADPDALRLAAALEAHSTHPIARALVADLTPPDDAAPAPSVDAVRPIGGAGIAGRVDDHAVIVGSPALITRELGVPLAVPAAIAAGHLTPVVIAIDGVIRGYLGFGDRLRPDAADAVATLRDLGLNVRILSGDDPAVVARVAASLNVTDYRGGATPEDKLAAVETLQSAGHDCIFVGDGVNDAAALAAAAVGVAVHGGAEASLTVADAYITRPGLSGIVELVEGSRRTMSIIRRTLVASFMYNLLAVAGTLAGFVTPLLAALIMPLSSITVLSAALAMRSFDLPGRPRSSPARRTPNAALAPAAPLTSEVTP